MPKNRRLTFQSDGLIDVPDYGLFVKRLKTKGFKSLTTILDYTSVSSFCHGVYADGNKLVATDHRHLVILDNSEELPDGSITDPKTGELIETAYPDYKSCIPKYDLVVKYDISFLMKKANDVVNFAKNTTNKNVVGLDFGIYRSAVDARLLLQAMSVFDANGSKTVKIGFDGKDPQKPITFQADNGNFAMIMPVVVDWEEPTIPILTTIIGEKAKVQPKPNKQEPKEAEREPTTVRPNDAEKRLFNMTVMAKYKNEKFKAMDVTAGVQVNNLIRASLIKSDKLDELIALLAERVTDDWQFKVVKAGTNTVLWQSGKTTKQKESENPTEKKASETKATSGRAKNKTVPGRNKKSEKADVPTVEQMPAEIALLKSFVNMHGVVKTKTQVYNIIKKLQKAIADKAVRKTSPHAAKIEYMQRHLIEFYNDMKGSQKTFEIPSNKLAELKKVVNIKLADHVVIIRAFINILNETKTGLMQKAKALHKKIGDAKFADSAEASMEIIRKSLTDYISGKTDTVKISEFALQGLRGLTGLSGLGELPNVPANTIPADNKILSATDFKNASFRLMGFTGKWLQLIGDPSVPFKAMIWGTGGSGKSTLAIEFARYLAGTLNKRVLYVANEEGAGATLHEKMTRLNAFHPNLFIAKTLPMRLVEYDFVFCDSANSMQMELPKFEQAAKLYPRLSWVLLFQTTKDGNFLGEKNWQHAVDVEIYCEDGKAKALKSRFGGKEMIEIW